VAIEVLAAIVPGAVNSMQRVWTGNLPIKIFVASFSLHLHLKAEPLNPFLGN
jgi:hypothetical protein